MAVQAVERRLGVLMVNGFASAAFFALSKTGLVVNEYSPGAPLRRPGGAIQ